MPDTIATLYTFVCGAPDAKDRRRVERLDAGQLAAREDALVHDWSATLINSNATRREYVTRTRRWVVELGERAPEPATVEKFNLGEQVAADPAIAERQAQLVQLRAVAPMRQTTAQYSTGGLGLFDAVDRAGFDFGDA